MKNNIHSFSQGEHVTKKAVLETIGIRGREAMELASLDLPILPGFLIDTTVAADMEKQDVRAAIQPAMKRIEEITGNQFGNPENTMLVKCVVSPSLVIATYPLMHNFGLTDDVLPGFMKFVGEGFARQEVLFLMSGVLEVQQKIAELEEKPDQAKACAAARAEIRGALREKLTAAGYEKTGAKFRELLPKGFFENAYGQLELVLKLISKMLRLDAADSSDTAVLVQPMVYGNYGRDSASGSFYTRNIVTGAGKLQGEFYQAKFDEVGAEGKDISKISKNYLQQLETAARSIEDHFKEIRSVRFTIQKKRLWLIDQRGVMSKSTQAEIQTLLDLQRRKIVDSEHIVMAIKPGQLNEILHPIVDLTAVGHTPRLDGGVAGAPGAAIGRVFFSTDGLLEEYKRAQQSGEDTRLILCMGATYADDVKAIEVANGVLSNEGGYAAHASVVARQYGKVSLVKSEMKLTGKKAKLGATTISEGDYITLSVAFHGEPHVYLGAVPLIEPDPEESGLIEYLTIIDSFIGDFHVRANADTPRDASLAQRFGAGGIGLCRTEHMFFHEERINVFRQLILADGVEDRRKVLAELLPIQKSDFYKLFKIMAGKPVTIRLLDAPLHEFLPHNDGEMKAFLSILNKGKRNNKVSEKLVRERAESFHEFNPMLGHRGCRLAVSYPEIYEMQVRAIFQAAYAVQKEGVVVSPEIMIPLIMNQNELKLIIYGKRIEGTAFKGLVDIEREVRESLKTEPLPYKVGTMIELPIAALSAGEISRYAQFFSFGTNDLTQTTMGLSRDDYTSFMPDYTQFDILAGNPFQVLDDHVKELVAIAHHRGTLTRPDLKTGLCGEHGAIPENIRFCMETGLNYVSCSSYSVPIAKLAVAQLNIESARS